MWVCPRIQWHWIHPSLFQSPEPSSKAERSILLLVGGERMALPSPPGSPPALHAAYSSPRKQPRSGSALQNPWLRQGCGRDQHSQGTPQRQRSDSLGSPGPFPRSRGGSPCSRSALEATEPTSSAERKGD